MKQEVPGGLQASGAPIRAAAQAAPGLRGGRVHLDEHALIVLLTRPAAAAVLIHERGAGCRVGAQPAMKAGAVTCVGLGRIVNSRSLSSTRWGLLVSWAYVSLAR
jgi:hypothetical protein